MAEPTLARPVWDCRERRVSGSARGDAHPAHALELFRTVFPSSLPSAACPRTATCARVPLSFWTPRGSRATGISEPCAEGGAGGAGGSVKANSRDNAPRLSGLDLTLRAQTGNLGSATLFAARRWTGCFISIARRQFPHL